MQEVGMMMTLTDVASWTGYNETIDIFFQKGTGRPEWIGREACANTHWVFLILMSYNSKLGGVLFCFFLVFGFCACFCVSNNPTHLLRPGDRGKSVLKILGWGEFWAERQGEKRRERRKKTLGTLSYLFSGLTFWCLLLIPTHTPTPPHT